MADKSKVYIFHKSGCITPAIDRGGLFPLSRLSDILQLGQDPNSKTPRVLRIADTAILISEIAGFRVEHLDHPPQPRPHGG